ncbi:hypothetical protein SAMN02982989_2611 [Xaviernesmea oryzae]|uniref:Uncharacterized protein n=1 Tax=Xaviernesmea oryzae TaxID=464029 RepID=A0A1X7FAX0_9HYPH|nr:hypothetical protein SAMN02982989_2611 [Xaviernesmea oryzae]
MPFGMYVYGVVSEAATSPTVDLSSECYPDGYRPARPGYPQVKRNANWQKPHRITSIIESKAFA